MKKLKFIIILFIVICLSFVGYLKFGKHYFDVISDTVQEKKQYVFFEKGITFNKTKLYNVVKDKYEEVGELEKNIPLSFVKLVDDYFLIDGFDKEYYIKVEDVVESVDEVEDIDTRYKEYIVFNENIVTNDETNFYDDDNNLLYSLDYSYDLPIIIKDTDRYGIEFNNRLVYVKVEDVKEVRENRNTDKKNASGVGVLNYHFFYDENNEKERIECNQIICESVSQFQSDLDYLKENDIMTITIGELEWYIDGKINLPKSVLITIDDGYMMNNGINLLEKNKMYATVFLITSWFDTVNFKDDFEYVEFHSHGEKLHDVGVCPGGQGGAIKCLDKQKLLDDLSISSNKLGGSKYFAYPFYEYNNYSIEVLKEAGFSMAFAGEYTTSDSLVHVETNKYKLPRFVMLNSTTKNDLDRYFGNIK